MGVRARAGAGRGGGPGLRLDGGVATVRQYLQAGLVNELHLAVAPVLLGSGESLLAGIDMAALGYVCAEYAPTARAAHVILKRRVLTAPHS